MSNLTPATSHLKQTQWKPGQSGNPSGKPKGSKHLSTWIRELMEDESFTRQMPDGSVAKGAPIKAVITAMIYKAMEGDTRAFDLLGKYAYGSRFEAVREESGLPVPLLGIVNMTEEQRARFWAMDYESKNSHTDNQSNKGS